MNPSDPPVAIEELLAHREWVRGLARRLVGGDADVDDVEQETWLAGLRHPPGDRATVRAWLARVVRNRVTDRHRSASRRERHESAAPPPSRPESPADVVARSEAHGRVVWAVNRLAEPYRTTVLLRFYDGLPPREVAARMGVPVETVRTRTRRGLERMRASLDEWHGDDRRAWCLLLLPLTEAPAPSTGHPARPAAGAAAATLAGALMATTTKTVLVAAVVLLAAVGLWAGSTDDDPPPAGGPGPATAAADAVSADPPKRPRVASGGSGPAAGAPDASGEALVRVRVRDTRGAPLAGAAVTLRRQQDATAGGATWDTHDLVARLAASRGPAHTVTTDEQGAAAVTGLAFGAWEITVHADGYETRAAVAHAVEGAAAPDVEVVLGRGQSLSGRVLEHDGSPVSGALLLVEPGFAVRGTTAADGSFALGGLAVGDAWIWVARPGAAPARMLSVRIPGVEDLEIRLGGGVLRGRVLDRDTRAPVAGADVRVFAGATVAEPFAARADAEGRFELRTTLDGDVHSVTVRAPGYAAAAAFEGRAYENRITLRRGEACDVTVLVARGGRVTGVVRAAGEPVAGAGVEAVWWPPQGPPIWTRATADGEGRYTLQAAPAGPNVIRCSAPGHAQPGMPADAWAPRPEEVPDWTVDVRAGETAPFDVRLDAGACVTGLVLDARGRPAEGALVACVDTSVPAATLADGTFTLGPVPREAGLEVLAWLPGSALARTTVDTSAEETVEGVRLTLGPAVVVSGVVEVPGGIVPDGTLVQVADAEVVDAPRSQTDGQWAYAPRFPVDADGRFSITLPPMRADGIVVRASAPGLAQGFSGALDPSADRHDGVRITLAPGGVLHGRATYRTGGGAVAGALVRLAWLEPGQAAADAVAATVVATTDERGAFRVDGLGAGRVAIVVERGDAAVSRVVDVRGEQRIDVALPASTAIAGVVRLPDGAPVGDVLVSAQPHQEPGGADAPLRSVAALPEGVRTDERGAFRIEHLPPGTYDLTLRSPADAARPIVQHVRSGVVAGTRDLVVTVAAGGVVEGTVVDASGTPRPGAIVAAHDAQGAAVAHATTTTGGAFRCVGLPGERVRLVASVHDDLGAVGEGSVDAAVGARGVRIVLDASHMIEGRVVGGGPVEGGVVGAIPENARARVAVAWIGASGRFRVTSLDPGRYRLVYVAPGADVSVHARWLAQHGARLLGGESVGAGTRGLDLRVADGAAEAAAGAAIRGVVLLPDGRPAPAAMVHAAPEGGGAEEMVRADADGRFRIGPLAQDRRYRVRVWSQGHTLVDLHDVAPGDAELRVTLDEGLSATGRLLRADGEPLADEEFALRHVETEAPALARTDADGRFEVRGLLPGRHQVRVRVTGADGTPSIVVVGELDAGARDVVLTVE